MSDIKQSYALPDVMMASHRADIAIGHWHRISRERHHLRPVLDMEVIQARFPELCIPRALEVNTVRALYDWASTHLSSLSGQTSYAQARDRRPPHRRPRYACEPRARHGGHGGQVQVCGTCCALDGALYATPRAVGLPGKGVLPACLRSSCCSAPSCIRGDILSITMCR